MKKQIKFHVRFETSILPRYPKITLILFVYFNNNNSLIFTIQITSQFLINRLIEEKIRSILSSSPISFLLFLPSQN